MLKNIRKLQKANIGKEGKADKMSSFTLIFA